jgi:hypothetical protein
MKFLGSIFLGVIIIFSCFVGCSDAGSAVVGKWYDVNIPGNTLEFRKNNTVLNESLWSTSNVSGERATGKVSGEGKWEITKDGRILIDVGGAIPAYGSIKGSTMMIDDPATGKQLIYRKKE